MAKKTNKPAQPSIINPVMDEVDQFGALTSRTRSSVIRAATGDPKRHLTLIALEARLHRNVVKIRAYMADNPPEEPEKGLK